MRRKDSDGYDLPNETESVTLRKICNSSSSKTAYYDDTINCDSALTPQQLKNRKRASLKIQQSEDLVYESYVLSSNLDLNVRRQKHSILSRNILNFTSFLASFKLPEDMERITEISSSGISGNSTV